MDGIMTTSSRGWVRSRAAAAALALAAALTAGAASAATAASAVPAGHGMAGAPAIATTARTSAPRLGATWIIVVRRAGGKDSLWRVSPTDASATKLVNLPFRPARMLASPDGTRIAVLPSAVGAKIYVYNVVHSKLAALSFASRGIKQLDGVTWLSSTKLLVSGSSSAQPTGYPLADRLYSVTTTSGTPAAFRGLHGTEPSAAPGAKRLVYVRLRDGGPDAAQPGSRFVVESLMSLKLFAGSKPQVIGNVRYVNSLDIRRFHDPGVSADGTYVVTSTTGSDISVSYMVRAVATGKAVRTKNTTLAGRDATAWSHAGDKVAFWGMPPAGSTSRTDVYVYNAGAKVLTTDGPFSKVAVAGFAWAPDDSLLAYSLRSLGHADDQGHLWTIDPGTSATPTDLGQGGLPVWLP